MPSCVLGSALWNATVNIISIKLTVLFLHSKFLSQERIYSLIKSPLFRSITWAQLPLAASSLPSSARSRLSSSTSRRNARSSTTISQSEYYQPPPSLSSLVFIFYLYRCLLKCCQCCLWCLEKFMRFINRNAYIMCAVKVVKHTFPRL